MHIKTFLWAQLELLTFDFGLNNCIDIDGVDTTGANADNLVYHGQGMQFF